MQSADVALGTDLVIRRRPTATHTLSMDLGTVTARAAFSHVPFWQSLMGTINRVVQRPTPGNEAAPPRRGTVLEQVRGWDAESRSQDVCALSPLPPALLIDLRKLLRRLNPFISITLGMLLFKQQYTNGTEVSSAMLP